MTPISETPSGPEARVADPSERKARRREAAKGILIRIYRLLFGRPLANGEAEEQKVGSFQGVPILGLDALGSASYGPEAALSIFIPLGAWPRL